MGEEALSTYLQFVPEDNWEGLEAGNLSLLYYFLKEETEKGAKQGFFPPRLIHLFLLLPHSSKQEQKHMWEKIYSHTAEISGYWTQSACGQAASEKSSLAELYHHQWMKQGTISSRNVPPKRSSSYPCSWSKCNLRAVGPFPFFFYWLSKNMTQHKS